MLKVNLKFFKSTEEKFEIKPQSKPNLGLNFVWSYKDLKDT